MALSSWLSGLILLLTTVAISAQSTSGGPCLEGNRLDKVGTCLRHISDLLFDENRFFFGKDLDKICDAAARNNSDNINCFVDDNGERRYSLASRLFRNNVKAELIDRYLAVTFSTLPRRYKACGAEGFPVSERTTDVNPDMEPTPVVYVRAAPKFSMRTEKDVYYTIVILDATYGYVHGLIVDYPAPKDIIPFKAPLNFRNMTNTFVFVVYRQSERDYMLEPRTLGLMKSPESGRLFKLNEFAADHALVGPIAMNWMAVTSDPYAVQQVADQFNENYCIKFTVQAFSELEFTKEGNTPYQNGKFSSVPYDVSKVDTVLNVTYKSPAADFFVCCQQFQYPAALVTLNPISPSGQILDQALSYVSPTISLESSALRPLETGPPTVRSYILFAVSPSAADNKNPPSYFWHTYLNDRDTVSPKSGRFQTSLGPAKLIFLLYERPGIAMSANSNPYSDLDSYGLAGCAGTQTPCPFDLPRFVLDHGLVLRGVNWITTVVGPRTLNQAISTGAGDEATVCRGQPGYSQTCPRPTGRLTETSTKTSLAVSLYSAPGIVLLFVIVAAYASI
ncbi:putative Uncharacterized protein C56G2.4 [Hypsibius exemplaris]|uniref:Uncharacterized protein n=1 Tax=Hypsibius exemplaris TaxID=2072580 RepID=A0A1W0X1Y1_HYPEX|nr:putative Uncharacterized protein C56G2.4 [Hypsibius exemplaris]